jgi:hypothetical protein
MTAVVSDDAIRQTLAVLRQCGGSKRAAAQALNIGRSTLSNRLRLGRSRGIDAADGGEVLAAPPPLPFGERIDDAELWNKVEANYRRNRAAFDAAEWAAVPIRSNAPMGICWFGDPHLDDNGCDIPALRRHIAAVAGTPGMVGANLGDTTNNWVGRLVRLYENQPTTRHEAHQLAYSFLMRSGIEWILILIGNHDDWRGGAEILAQMTRHVIPLSDWQARIRLVFPNKREVPIWAAHDFPGNSQWNSLHGPMKKAMLSKKARLYVCGHRHNWALAAGEDAHGGGVYWLARARGYKAIDAYADNGGFGRQEHGQSIVSVIDPQANSDTGLLRCFEDVEDGAQYLTWLRQRAGIKDFRQ